MNPSTRSYEECLEQHKGIRNQIAEMKHFLEKPRPPVGTDESLPWATELAEKLTALHNSVFKHFREEEKSGFFDELSQKFPRAARTLDVLRLDHDRILADFRSVLGATMIYAEGKEPDSPRLRRWTLSVLDGLSRHEQEETELCQKLHYQEAGNVD